MSSKSKAPKAPDYAALAREQAALQQQSIDKATAANRADQSNPFGSLDWSQDPTTGAWSQNVSLAPEYEAIREQQAANQGGMAGLVGEAVGGYDASQLDLSGAPKLPEVGGYNQQAIDTIRALQAPQIERQRAAKEARLAAMGMGTGSGQAWNTEQQNIGDQENRADMNAILSGLQQGNVEFGQGLQANQAYISNALREKAANLQQLQGLQQANPLVQSPTFAGYNQAGTANAPNLTGAAQQQYQASLDAANSKGGGIWGTVAPIVGGAVGSFFGPMGTAAGAALGNAAAGNSGGKGGGKTASAPDYGSYTNENYMGF